MMTVFERETPSLPSVSQKPEIFPGFSFPVKTVRKHGNVRRRHGNESVRVLG